MFQFQHEPSAEHPAVQAERRQSVRIEPPGVVMVSHSGPLWALADAEVLNLSRGGAALRVRQRVDPGEVLSFSVGAPRPPVMAEVLACESVGDGWWRVRCKCLSGGFDVDQG